MYYERRDSPRNRLHRLLYSAIVWNYRAVTLERIVEVPWMFANLGVAPGAHVLDFGCSESPVALELASLGYRVVAADLRPYPLSHPNLTVRQGDFLAAGFASGEFDVVVAISAIEHCGLSAYGEVGGGADDRAVMGEIRRVLRPAGRLLLTVPYGRAGTTSWYRVYDRAALAALLDGFRVVRANYYRGLDRRDWQPVAAPDLEDVDSVGRGFVQGVVCVAAERAS